MSTRITAALVSLMMCAVMLSGCLQADDENKIISEELDSNNGVFVTGVNGQSIDIPPLPLNFVFSNGWSRAKYWNNFEWMYILYCNGKTNAFM